MAKNPSKPPRVRVNPFALRHTPASPFSHSDLPLSEIASIIENDADVVLREGYRDGVLLARLPRKYNSACFSAIAIVEPNEPVWEGARSRREAEAPRPYREVVRHAKSPAQCVDVVLYRQDVAEVPNPDPDTWDIISLNAYADDETDPPLLPTTIMCNALDALSQNPADPESIWQTARQQIDVASAYWCTRANVQLARYLQTDTIRPATPPAPLSHFESDFELWTTRRALWYALGAPNNGPHSWCVQVQGCVYFIAHDPDGDAARDTKALTHVSTCDFKLLAPLFNILETDCGV